MRSGKPCPKSESSSFDEVVSPVMRRYQDLKTRGQVGRLRPIAEEMASQFGWSGAEMRLLNHGYNTTFGLRKGDERAALRINVNSIRTLGQLQGELAWVHALRDTDVWVPQPYRRLDGDGFLARVPRAHLLPDATPEQELYGVLYSWLPGRTTGHNWSPVIAHEVGRATTALHLHAATWNPPRGAVFSDPVDVMLGEKLEPRANRPGFEDVLARGNAVLAKLRAQEPMRPIHFDIHMWNLRWHRNRLAVFDFDDCRAGWRAWDVAITLFYMRRFPNPTECEPAYWEGLGLSLDDLGVTHDEMEALVACRGIFLASEMLKEWTAELQQIGTGYVDVTEKRIEHYLKTGTFDPSVASLPG